MCIECSETMEQYVELVGQVFFLQVIVNNQNNDNYRK